MQAVSTIFINILIVGLFLYSKLLPYQGNLSPNYKKLFSFFNNIFSPVLKLLRNVFTPYPVGGGVGVDLTQIVLLVLFLIILNIIH